MKTPFDRWTDEQRKMLRAMQENPRLVIFGSAGTGKTRIAMETANRLMEDGMRVLILCYNPFLANTYRNAMKGQEIYVADFCALVRVLVKSQGVAGLILPKLLWVNSQPWTEFDCPNTKDLNLAQDYLYHLPSRFDAVIVDEGEEFLSTWWAIVEACLSDKEKGALYVFVDDNDRVYEFQPFFRYDMYEAPFHLSCNCRSAAQIAQIVQKLHPYPNKLGHLSERQGILREWVYPEGEAVYAMAAEALLAAETVFSELQDVVVITTENRLRKDSKFNGLIVDSPRLASSGKPGRVKWQGAIETYLGPYGFPCDNLSRKPSPEGADLRQISGFCADYKSYNLRQSMFDSSPLGRRKLKWVEDHRGELKLTWENGSPAQLSHRDVMDFFQSSSWASLLPKPHRRYRVSIPEDFVNYPDYQNVPLVDVTTFKGLEAGGVIYILYDYIAPYEFHLQQQLYAAFSRAKHLLHLIGPYSLSAKAEDFFKNCW